MLEDIEKDFCRELTNLPITLFGNKIRVGIIGGGRGALIKAKTLIKSKAFVQVLALNFIEEFHLLDSNNIQLIEGSYNKDFLHNKHLIIIAIDDEKVVKEIIEHCNNTYKIYINSTKYKEGLAVIPVCRESDTLTISVNTKVGNPTAAVMVADYAISELSSFDEFLSFSSIIRNNLVDVNKVELMKFINTEDFIFYYKKNKWEMVLKLFYSEKKIDHIKECFNNY